MYTLHYNVLIQSALQCIQGSQYIDDLQWIFICFTEVLETPFRTPDDFFFKSSNIKVLEAPLSDVSDISLHGLCIPDYMEEFVI